MRGVVFTFIVVVLFSGMASALLGISPAKQEFRAVPGQSHEVLFRVSSDQPGLAIQLSVEGGLSDWVTLDKEEVYGGERFVATLTIPEGQAPPGRHRIYVGAAESEPDEAGQLGSLTKVQAVFEVFVPYPGKYVAVGLDVPNANIDEEVEFTLHLDSQGTENVSVAPSVVFYDLGGDQVGEVVFEEFLLPTLDRRDIGGRFSTEGWVPGQYLAEGRAAYDGMVTLSNRTFLVGSLFVSVTNFTRTLPRDEGIQRFLVSVESRWNGGLDDVFAEVNLSQDGEGVGWRTPSLSLNPWEIGVLEGFVDTSGLEGLYDAQVVVRYGGTSTTVHGEVRFVSSSVMWWVVGIGVIFVLGIGWSQRRRFLSASAEKGKV